MIPSPFHGIFSSLEKKEQHALEARRIPEQDRTIKPQDSEVASVTKTPTVGQVALDIFEFDNYYIIKAPIAGVKMSDIDIDAHDNVLTIRGQREQTDTIADSQYYLRECFWGPFERTVTLPCTIDPRKVKATFNKESILKIIVPKEERIKIIRIND